MSMLSFVEAILLEARTKLEGLDTEIEMCSEKMTSLTAKRSEAIAVIKAIEDTIGTKAGHTPPSNNPVEGEESGTFEDGVSKSTIRGKLRQLFYSNGNSPVRIKDIASDLELKYFSVAAVLYNNPEFETSGRGFHHLRDHYYTHGWVAVGK